jgi:hypothetical protein
VNPLSATTLGIYISHADTYGDFEVIPVSIIDAPLALIPVHLHRTNQDLWISISFDRVGHNLRYADFKPLTNL